MKQLLVLGMVFGGCALQSGPKVRYLDRPISRVAVLPPFNSTVKLEVSEQVWPYVIDAIAERNYAIVPMETIQEFYQRHRFKMAEEARTYSDQELGKQLECEGLVFCNVNHLGQRVLVTSQVDVEVEFVDAHTGEVIFRGSGTASQGKSSFNINPLGALTGGESVISETTDLDPLLREAMSKAFADLPHCHPQYRQTPQED